MSNPKDEILDNAIITLSLHVVLELLPLSGYSKRIQRELKLRINRMIAKYDNAANEQSSPEEVSSL